MNKFNKFFKNLEKEFNDLNSLKEIRNSDHKIHWGEGYGVYTLWNKEIDFKNLIYVGLTGKYTRDIDGKVKLNPQTFSKRKYRYTPYRFCESTKDQEDLRFTFRYGPNYKGKTQGKNKYERDAYKNTIRYKDLIIITLDLTKIKKYSPALLESMILTEYLAEKGDLPPANNEL
jgi:hypothetical protein